MDQICWSLKPALQQTTTITRYSVPLSVKKLNGGKVITEMETGK